MKRRIKFNNTVWVPLGNPNEHENFQDGASVYSAYLRYTHEQNSFFNKFLASVCISFR